MPMRYANPETVLAQLEITNPDQLVLDRLEGLENGLCDVFDQRIGHGFGEVPVAQTRTIRTHRNPSCTLVLLTPMRSIDAIAINGTWNGTVWDDETMLDAADYLPAIPAGDESVYWGIERLNGTWPIGSRVRVTGIWDDQPQTDIPDDLREAVTFVLVDEWRARNASPAGEIGPEGLVVQVRNPWRWDLVTRTIAKYQVRKVFP